jgi:hypothetical protein
MNLYTRTKLVLMAAAATILGGGCFFVSSEPLDLSSILG